MMWGMRIAWVQKMTVERNLRIFDKSALQRQTKYQSKIG
jgi:hypothetical protein